MSLPAASRPKRLTFPVRKRRRRSGWAAVWISSCSWPAGASPATALRFAGLTRMAKRKEENMTNEQIPKTLEEALSQGWHWSGEIGHRSEDKKTFEGVAELGREGQVINVPCKATYEFGQPYAR